MRNGDAATEAGGRLLLTGERVGLEAGSVRTSGLGDQFCKIVNHVVLGRPKIDVEHNQISSDQVLRHGYVLSYYVRRGR